MPIFRSGYATAKDKIKAYGYNTAHWKRVRQSRLMYDKWLCTIQLPGCNGWATTVDLDPALNGNHALATLDNTRSACRHCHGKVDGGGSRR